MFFSPFLNEAMMSDRFFAFQQQEGKRSPFKNTDGKYKT